MYELDAATALTRADETRFTLEVSDGWGIYQYPNGGFLAALGLRALGELVAQPDPMSFTAHYLRPAQPGRMTIECEVVREGRTSATAQARLIQGGKERVRMIAAFGDLDANEGTTLETASPTPVPPLSECVSIGGPPMGSTFADRIELRFVPGTAAFLEDGDVEPQPALGGWVWLKDERPTDLLALALYADAWPPPVLNVVPRVWVPTVELTVHLRRRPAPGPVRAWFRTDHIVDGVMSTDGKLWDEQGRFVALSRQLARLKQP